MRGGLFTKFESYAFAALDEYIDLLLMLVQKSP